MDIHYYCRNQQQKLCKVRSVNDKRKANGIYTLESRGVEKSEFPTHCTPCSCLFPCRLRCWLLPQRLGSQSVLQGKLLKSLDSAMPRSQPLDGEMYEGCSLLRRLKEYVYMSIHTKKIYSTTSIRTQLHACCIPSVPSVKSSATSAFSRLLRIPLHLPSLLSSRSEEPFWGNWMNSH